MRLSRENLDKIMANNEGYSELNHLVTPLSKIPDNVFYYVIKDGMLIKKKNNENSRCTMQEEQLFVLEHLVTLDLKDLDIYS